MENWLTDKSILITGGTSGLGRSLVLKFLANGNNVISIARNESTLEIEDKNYKHYVCDFSDLSNLRQLVEKLIIKKISVDILINNAGVLSPPDYQETVDGFELSYQVNFLSHLLLTRLLLSHNVLNSDLIVNTSSPIHTRGHLDLEKTLDKNEYKLFKNYAHTKLYMAMLSKLLSEEGRNSFSFNPGTFNSGIYRLQKKWFHAMYKIAAPFMSSSKEVANCLHKIIENKNWKSGKMINKKGKESPILHIDELQYKEFWDKVNRQISKHLV